MRRDLYTKVTSRRDWTRIIVWSVAIIPFIFLYIFLGADARTLRDQVRRSPADGRTTVRRFFLKKSATGQRLLFGGQREEQHFDISTFKLNPRQLRYGLGREAFPALLSVRFEPVSAAAKWLQENEKVLVVKIKNDTRIYPIRLLIRHEVVNDVIGEIPIFASYCILANLGCVYDRRIAGATLTFAVSGYTYGDVDYWDGRQAFVLWDRDTESLWWPPMGIAVSGTAAGQPLTVLDQALWAQSTWGEAAAKYPTASVMRRNQLHTPPTTWPRLVPPLTPVPTAIPASAFAPRWGENREIR